MKNKRRLSLILSVTFALLLLASCKGEPAPAPVPEPSAAPAVTEAPAAPKLFDGSEPSEECAGLVTLADVFGETGMTPELYPLGEDLLCADTVETADGRCLVRLKLISSETGLPLAEDELSCGWLNYVYSAGKTFVIVDPEASAAYVYDSSLTRRECTLNTAGEYANYFTDPDARYLYSASYLCDSITVTDLETGETDKIALDGTEIVLSCVSGNTACLRYTGAPDGGDRYCALDLPTKKFTPLDYDGLYFIEDFRDGTVLAEIGAAYDTYRIDGPGGSCVFCAEAVNVSLGGDSGLIVVRSFDESGEEPRIVCSAYLRDGAFVSSFDADCTRYLSAVPVYSPKYKGFFFFAGDYLPDSNRLLFWDCSARGEGEDLEMTPYSEFLPEPGNAVAAKLYVRADKMAELYGFELLIADRTETEYDDFYAERCTDYWKISSALDQLELALANYPEGYFSLLTHDDIQKIRIHLTGKLSSRSAEEFGGNYQAFVQYTGGCYTLVMDVSGDTAIMNSFCHEFSHMTDSKLESDAWEREDALFSEEDWCALNPPGFVYTWAYTGTEEENAGYDGWFIDGYAQSFPTEDRARIMEYAVCFPWTFDGNRRLLSKLDYYSRCIREALDTGDWPETLPWEKPLYDYGYRQPDGPGSTEDTWVYEPQAAAEATVRSALEHLNDCDEIESCTILSVMYDEPLTLLNLQSLIDSELARENGFTGTYLESHFAVVTATYDLVYSDSGRGMNENGVYKCIFHMTQDESDGLWRIWDYLTPYLI